MKAPSSHLTVRHDVNEWWFVFSFEAARKNCLQSTFRHSGRKKTFHFADTYIHNLNFDDARHQTNIARWISPKSMSNFTKDELLNAVARSKGNLHNSLSILLHPCSSRECPRLVCQRSWQANCFVLCENWIKVIYCFSWQLRPSWSEQRRQLHGLFSLFIECGFPAHRPRVI